MTTLPTQPLRRLGYVFGLPVISSLCREALGRYLCVYEEQRRCGHPRAAAIQSATTKKLQWIQKSCRSATAIFNPHYLMQIKLWQIWTHVRKQYPAKSKSRERMVGAQRIPVTRSSAVFKVRYRARGQSGQTTSAAPLLSGRWRFQQIQVTDP